MELFVQYNQVCTHSEREDVAYGEWSEKWDYEVKGVSISSRGRWSGLAYSEDKINVGFEAEADTPVYVLWMTYSQGDSFGHGSGYGEILWVFQNESVARQALAEWKSNEEQYTVVIKDETGKKIELTNPGAGYFESVDSLQVVKFILSI